MDENIPLKKTTSAPLYTSQFQSQPRPRVRSIPDYCQFISTLRTDLQAHIQSEAFAAGDNNTMSRPTLSDLIERNRTYAPSHAPSPTFAEFKGSGAAGPRVLVVTCADPRCEPNQFLNIAPFDAVAIRSIGGRVEPQIPSILAVDTLFSFEEIAVIHHTDCGATMFNKEHVARIVKERAPDRAEEIDKLEFGDFKDLIGSVKEDLKILRENPYISKQLREHAHGFVFNIKTGEVTNAEM